MSFFASHFLWLDVVIAAAFSAAAVGMVGTHAILRRVVFLPAALSQLSGLGVVVSFLIAHLIGNAHGSLFESPRLFAALFAMGGALTLGLWREGPHATTESRLGAVFIACSALTLLIGGAIPQELHDIQDILFGNAIMIERSEMFITVGLSVVVIALHAWLARAFVATAFDPTTLAAHGVRTRLLDGVLFLSMGLAVASSTRVVGALPAFAFAVFPGRAALGLSTRPRGVVAIAAILGAASAFFGYWISFQFSLPTGACMATVAFAVWLLASVPRWIRRGQG